MSVLVGILSAVATIALFTAARYRYASFAAQRPADYTEDSPVFDLRTHLSGPILCEGVVYGPLGRVASRFVGHFDARWDGNRGVMTEHFIYDSGETQDREWRLTLHTDGRIEALADDVPGEGRGWQTGPTVQLCYKLRLDGSAGGHVLDAVDWMYLAPNGTIVNRSQFRKFGIKVAELVATMRRAEAA